MIKRGFLKDEPFGTKMMVLFGMVILLLLASQMITLLLLRQYVSVHDLMAGKELDYTGPGIVNALKWSQIASAILTFIIPAWLFSRFVDMDSASYLKMNKSSSVSIFLLSAVAILVALPLINWLAAVNGHLPMPQWAKDMEAQATKLTEAFLKMDTIGDLILNIVMVGFLAAIGEEMLFRGTIQRVIGEIIPNKHVAIWVTGALFSAFHMQFAGFIPRMFLGAFLGYLLEWTGSLWIPILVHFTNNTMAVVASYLIGKGVVPAGTDEIGSNVEQEKMVVILSFALFLPLVFNIYKLAKARTDSQTE